MGPILLLKLPPEILENILSSLPPADILKVKEVSHLFLDIVSSSQSLQHRIDLFSAGLIDNPHVARSLTERRAQLRKYVDGWNNPETSVRYVFPLRNHTNVFCLYPIDQDLFSARVEGRTPIIHFVRIPPFPRQGTVKEWELEIPFHLWNHVVCSRENLLIIIEQGLEPINVHLLDLLDGSPHKVPLKKVIPLDVEPHQRPVVTICRANDSRIALVVKYMGPPGGHTRLVVLDWRMGEVVLEHSAGDPGIGNAINDISTMELLEGSWLIALSDRRDDAQLLVFDTLPPRQSWRILQLPQLPYRSHYWIPIRYENPPTECPEFSVDPSQKNFVVHAHRGWALVIPAGSLIQIGNSTRAEPYIQWDDWKEDVILVHPHLDSTTLQVVDTKLLAFRASPPYPEGYSVEVYDLSKSGRGDIQVREVGDEGYKGCWRVLSTPKWYDQLRMGDESPKNIFLIGSKVVSFYSRRSPSGEEYYTRTWKVG